MKRLASKEYVLLLSSIEMLANHSTISQLAILVVSAGITELSFSIQEIDSLLFELQVSP